MNVLVVDDLYEVVQGVVDGVNWKSMGIDGIFTAYSVEEACEVLRQREVSLLLCDIEMPPHSGFELLQWMREHDMDAECIFLTSHAEFEYAQQAVKLGSFDYILQPARYTDIEAAVQRALARVADKHRARDAAQYGQFWKEKRNLLAEACVTRYLRSGGEELDSFLEELGRMGVSIGHTTEICPILIQLHRDTRGDDADGLRALFSELLDRTEDTQLVVGMEEGCFLALFFGGSACWAELGSALEQASSRWESEGRSRRPTCYVGDVIRPDALCGQLKLLRKRMQDNVARYSGVFAPTQREEILHYVYTFPDMRRWARLLESGECAQVREEALNYLRQQRDEGKVNAEFLAKFHQDFIQTFFTVAQAYKTRTHDIFYEEYPFNDFLQAYTSYDKMVSLVRFAVDYVAQKIAGPAKNESPVEQAVRYIQQNIERDLHRSDVAEAIFMNGDHLARLFKKEMGVSLHDFIIQEKMRVAESLLRGTNLPVSLVASKVGYPNFSYFSQAFKRLNGMTPGEYRTRKS